MYIQGATGGNVKKSNTNKTQTFQNNIVHKITNSPPYYISNPTLHNDPKIKTVHEEAVTFYKRFHSKLPSHTNPLISSLATFTIPGSPSRRLRRKWRQDLLNGINLKYNHILRYNKKSSSKGSVTCTG